MAKEIIVAREPDYADLDLDFFKNPKTDQLVIKTGSDAVKRAVRNLIFTNYYERPFQSYIGSGVRELLFENFTPLTAIEIKKAIELVLSNFEPRIAVNSVLVKEDIDLNGFEVTINFTILNKNEPVVTTVFLERIR